LHATARPRGRRCGTLPACLLLGDDVPAVVDAYYEHTGGQISELLAPVAVLAGHR